MKKGIASILTVAALLMGGVSCFAADNFSLMAQATSDNPAYSERDGVFFTDSDINCDELHQADACELFRQLHSQYDPGYSVRDRVAFMDQDIECDELHASENCEFYRQEQLDASELLIHIANLNSQHAL